MYRKNLSLSDCNIKLDESSGFAGYASVFGGVDSYGDTIEKGAFEYTLEKHGMPKMFLNHESWELPIGKWTKAEEDETGLRMAGEPTPGNGRASDVYASMKHGTIDGLSIGFFLNKGDYEESKKGGIIIKRVSKLVEVSVVTFPADGAARIDLDSVKSSELESIETIRDFERFLRDAGGMTKGLALAVVSRAKTVFAQREAGGDEVDAKAMQELEKVLSRFKVPASFNG